MNKVNINGIDLAYARQGSGKPLMLIHGFPLDHVSWEQVADVLAKEFDIILPDLRGFGDSSAIESDYGMTDMADDLAGLLDSLGMDQIAVAGHSMGGYVALAFAKKYPQRVTSLALVSSQAAGDSPERKQGRYKTAQDVVDEGIGVVVDSMTPKFSSKPETQMIAREAMARQKPSGMIGALKAMAERDDMTSTISKFNFPLVLIHGDQDALIPVDRAREIKALVTSAKLIELPGAGHLPMLEFVNETAEALKNLK